VHNRLRTELPFDEVIMFGSAWGDPETLWLNLTNVGLGIVVLLCIGGVAYGILQDLVARRSRVPQSEVDSTVRRLLAGIPGPHSFHTPELGLTMADGGEPEEPESPESKKA
jgi:hypothetical protein